MKPVRTTDWDRQICQTIQKSSQATELMELLSRQIGPRPSGSQAIRQAQDILSKVFYKLGSDNVHTEPVSVIGWRAGASRVELLRPRRQSIESIQHVHSASGNIAAELLEVVSTSVQELDRLGQKLNGSIALIGGQQISGTKYIPLPERIAEIARRGVSALIIRNEYPLDCPAIELAGIGDDVAIPVVGISKEEAEQLCMLARREPVQIRIETSGQSHRCECSNLVAELGPERRADEVIVLSAHLDSFHISPGAMDNLTGVITMVEIALALAPFRTKFQRTLRLILFTGEEYGFIGSKAYVEQHADELEQIRFILNMDGLFSATAEGLAVMWSPAMRDYIDEAFQQTDCNVDVRNLFCMSSDYLPFMLAGIPAARPAHFDNSQYPPWTHTRFDTSDNVRPEWIGSNAQTLSLLLLRILTDPQILPAKLNSPREVRELIDKEKAGQALRSFGFDV